MYVGDYWTQKNLWPIEATERKRTLALSRWDSIEYFQLCNELGVEPEAKDLYEQGELESGLNSINDRRSRSTDKYSAFHKKGNSLNIRSFSTDADEKRRLLREYFPGRFGEKGKQSLSKLDDLQVGALFNKIMEYSKKRVQQ